MTKEVYYLTFCASHPQRKAYITITASSFDSAYKLAVSRFQMSWRDLSKEKPRKKTEIMKLEAP